MNIILSSAISLDDANNHEEEDEEGKSENHSNKPARSGNAIVFGMLNCDSI
jgi:hypothetical protein